MSRHVSACGEFYQAFPMLLLIGKTLGKKAWVQSYYVCTPYGVPSTQACKGFTIMRLSVSVTGKQQNGVQWVEVLVMLVCTATRVFVFGYRSTFDAAV